MKESWEVGTTRRGHDGTKEFPQTGTHRMTGSMECAKPPSTSVEWLSHPLLRHPGLEPGSSRRTSVSRKDSLTRGKRVFSREGLRVTGSRLKAGMTESWVGAE
jgi:hypothetical protein